MYNTTMFDSSTSHYREVFTLIVELARAVRCCQNGEVFCENVTFSQFFILDVLAEKSEMQLADLHKILAVDKSTTTRLVNPLVSHGLVLRNKSEQDSRAINLSLTDEGREVHKKVWECLSGFLEGVQTRIPGDRREDILEATRIFLNALRDTCTAVPYQP